MTFHIRRTESPDAALRRVAIEQIGFVLRDFDDPLLDADAKIHSLRSRCKKMRALLRLVGPLMGDAFAREDARFANAGKSLGQLRDDYVQQRTLSELLGLESEPTPVPPVDNARGPELAAARQAMQDAQDAVPGWPFSAASFYDLAPGYGRSYAKGRAAWQQVLRERSDENFHKLRKWSKYLWYQTRLLERMNRRSLHLQRVRLQVLGELLGHAHDLAILETGAHVEVDEATLSLATRRKHRLYLNALGLCAVTFAATSDEQVANLSRWWQIWRQERR